MTWIKKVELSKETGSTVSAAYDDELQARCPALHEYLTSKVDGDGKARKTSSLSVFAEDGVFKAVLNERNQPLSLWASSDSLAGVLDALDGLLRGEATPWRTSGNQSSPKKR